MAKESPTASASSSKASDGSVNAGVAVIGFILCFLAGIALMFGYDQRRLRDVRATGGEDAASVWDDSESPVPVSSKDPMWGKRDAPVTMVIFSDFQCPYCSRVEAALAQVKEAYGPDKVRMVWKNNPLPMHASAKPAAEAATTVFAMGGSDAFWKWHDTAFKNQGALNADNFARWAQDAGVKDVARYKSALAAHQYADKVDKDLSEGQSTGVNGTPAFFVNGVFLNGTQPFDAFKKTIDQEMQKAQAKIAAGTPRSRVYVELSKEARKNAPAATRPEPEDTTSVYKIPVADSPTIGGRSPLVTIVEFSDFQCPYCGRVEPPLKAVRTKYGDQVRLVWKNEPLSFHAAAEPAAEAALEVRAEKGDAAFWDMHDRLFADQQHLANGKDANIDTIVKAASDAGANPEKVRAAIANRTYKRSIEADLGVGADFQVNGTPSLFVNGRRFVGMSSEEAFQKEIDAEIAKAKELLAKGVKASDLYDTITRDGKGPPPPEMRDVPGGLPANDPVRGAPRSKVTVHEWSDFQCPFCARAEPTIAALMKDYGDKVKFVWHDFPLPMHPDAPLAAQAGREAYAQKGPTAFWAIHDRMFAAQQKLKREDLDEVARGLNLNMDRWGTALDGHTHDAEIGADQRAAESDHMQAAPAFLIVPEGATRGYFINGAEAYGKFQKAIDLALADASKR